MSDDTDNASLSMSRLPLPLRTCADEKCDGISLQMYDDKHKKITRRNVIY